MIKTLFQCQKGNADFNTFLQYQVGKIGRDWIILIIGGESHIGSISCSNRTLKENFSFTLTHHKEDALVAEAFQCLSPLVEDEIIIISGVHYDDIVEEQINIVLQYNQDLIKQTANFFNHLK